MKGKFYNYSEYVGKTVNRLRIDSFIPSCKIDNKVIKAVYSCTCINDGNVKMVRAAHVLNGNVKSCGCLSKEHMSSFAKKHGKSNTPEYNSYHSMKCRCSLPSYTNYADYGGRGIKICDRWLNSFENFYADMGERPEPKHLYSLDRIDVNGDYCKDNCKWSTASEQQRNKRRASKEFNIGYLKCLEKIKTLTQEYNVDIPQELYSKLKDMIND